jgi:hypothetical protein
MLKVDSLERHAFLLESKVEELHLTIERLEQSNV